MHGVQEPGDVPPTRHSGEGKVSRAGLLGSLVRRAAGHLPDRLEPF
jgi:hypothetical protein